MKVMKSLTQYLIKHLSDVLEVIPGVIVSLIFLLLLSGTRNDFYLNLCFALIFFLFVIVTIYIIIGLCRVLAGLLERFGE